MREALRMQAAPAVLRVADHIGIRLCFISPCWVSFDGDM